MGGLLNNFGVVASFINMNSRSSAKGPFQPIRRVRRERGAFDARPKAGKESKQGLIRRTNSRGSVGQGSHSGFYKSTFYLFRGRKLNYHSREKEDEKRRGQRCCGFK